MARVKKDVEEITEELETDFEETPEYKTETFLKSFNASNEYRFILYKHEPNGKRVIVTKFENTIPDLIEDIQSVYGGGTYEFYAYETVNGVEKFKAQKFNLAEPSKKERYVNPEESELNALKKIGMIKEMFSGNTGGGNNEILLQMMKFQADMNEKIMSAQMKSQKEMTDLILSMKNNSGSNDIKSAIELYNMINDLKDNAGGHEESFIEKLLPAALPILQNLGASINAPAAPANKPVIKDILNVDEIDAVIAKIPDDMKNRLTFENKESVIDYFYSKNADKFSRSGITQIIDRVLALKNAS